MKAAAVITPPTVMIHLGAILSSRRPLKIPPVAYNKKLIEAAMEITDLDHWYSSDIGLIKMPKQ